MTNRGLLLLALMTSIAVAGQVPPTEEDVLFAKLDTSAAVPANLLSTRTVVFYSPPITKAELQQMQEAFFKTGIDAIAYFEADRYLAGRDSRASFDQYLSARDVRNLLFVTRPSPYRLLFVSFQPGSTQPIGQNGWKVENASLAEALTTLYRTASIGQVRTNMLVNEYAETDLLLQTYPLLRNEFYAVDLKVDLLGVQKTGVEIFDTEVENLLKEVYPFKFKMVEAELDEPDIRQQGYIFVLRFLHARGNVVQNLLGYNTQEKGNALVSVTYRDGQPQLKTFPSSSHVYKFYVRHTLSATNYLGTRWDADEQWQDALRNHINGLKVEMQIK